MHGVVHWKEDGVKNQERKFLKAAGFSRGAIKVLEAEAEREKTSVMKVTADVGALMRIFEDVARAIAKDTNRNYQDVLRDMLQKLQKSHEAGTLESELKTAVARLQEKDKKTKR
ncbi:MAG: hypothetical protein A2745_01950 [Candidatus Harrisonbacteria bacterium RIFCSPHIGHO2_01_FULL_44_13]|uniref:Uncharacterized protein n=1 Tax=Candidatus Harrisonbacteria bacterium RIFCSPLOWO2_01_FULL_44_18 TaxID=1798407 RepID=A0A1G1ZP03_9BACT|nr:MAG: hypothetical protein A2745_01950 [Candidatus Harrisonbacteria bacterium RIFCSPHIGHO2_01_FULL_44_13]OGY66324.1 MAG: hypothetical protein A3A16_00225 [Candidatus Harrisonbacteria bacterium RIFCSPLOWO2_01_FULL_44_18]